MHVTVTNLFPDVVIRSCRFHLGQAWCRTIQALGLAKEYKKNVTDISKWLRHFFGLAFFGLAFQQVKMSEIPFKKIESDRGNLSL
jgi:hypothetical protein